MLKSIRTRLAYLAYVARHFARRARGIGKRVIDRIDPTEKRLLPWSHVTRGWHQFGLQLCTIVAAVAITALPGLAMPVFSAAKTTGVSEAMWVTASAGLATIGATAKTPQLLPFRYGTVRRRINIGNFVMTPGTQLPAVVIPQVGMLSRVLFNISGTYTVATAPLVVFSTDGFDSFIAKAQIQLNNGSANVVDCSGIGLCQFNQNINTALPIKKGTPAGVGNVNGTQLPLALGASTFTYKGFLPVNANNRRQFEMGLINLQAPETRVNVLLSFNPLSQIVTVPANMTLFAATVNLSYEYFEIPDLSRFQLPPLTLVRSIEEAPIPIVATGLQLYQFPRLGTMIEYHTVLQLARLYAPVLTNFTEFAIRYNKTDQQYDVFMPDWETYEAELYGIGIDVTQAPTATAATPTSRWQQSRQSLTFNLWAAGDADINGGDFRDAIDTEENTTTEAMVFISAGTVLTPGQDNLYHVRRVVQRIIPVGPPSNAA